MRFVKYLILLGLLLPAFAYAQTVLPGSRGGTGFATTTAGNIGNCLVVTTNNPISYVLSTCGGGGGSSFPFTATPNYNSTSTPIGFLGGLFSTASSTFSILQSASTTLTGPFVFANATGTNATTTSFFSTTASSTNLFGANLSACTGANALTWSGGLFSCTAQPQGTVTSVSGTANQITSSGGATPTLSLPNHIIFPAGGFEVTIASTTNATTTGSQYFSGITASRPLYVDSTGKLGPAGTGTSGNCTQWGANNTLADAGSACGTGGGSFSFTPTTNYGATTNATGTPIWFQAGLQASTTNNFFAGLTVDNAAAGDALSTYGATGYEWSAGNNSTTHSFIISSSTGLTTNFALNIIKGGATSTVELTNLFSANATTTNATTTNFAFTGLATGGLAVNITGQVYKVATGTVSAGAGISVTGGQQVFGSGLTITNLIGYPFVGDATSTLINFSTGLRSASTTLTGPFVFANATGTNATTTNLFSTFASTTTFVATNASTTGLSITGQTSASGNNCLQIDTTGFVTKTGSACGSGGSGVSYGQTFEVDSSKWLSATTTGTWGVNANAQGQTYGFGIGDKLLSYASSTNLDTVYGLGAGGTNSTTTAAVSGISAFGWQAGSSLTTGTSSTAIGAFSMSNIDASTSPQNTAVGYGALWGNTTSITSALIGLSTAVGYFALASTTTGSQNTAIGYNAGVKLTTGSQNVFVGSQAADGLNSKTGSNNVCMGRFCLDALTSGNKNTAIGDSSLDLLTTGINNVALGYQTGVNVTSGGDNIIIGEIQNTGGGNLTTGWGNILVGYNAVPPTASTGLSLNIGNFLFGTLPATSTATSPQVPTSGLFGVGTTSPFAKLSVQTNNTDTTINLFAIGSSTATATTTHFLVKNDGSVFAANTTTSGGAQTGYWCYDANGQLIRDTVVCIAVSARRFKQNIQPLTVGLDELMKLQPVSYQLKPDYNILFKNDPNYNGTQYSLVADDVQKIDPRLVTVEVSTTTFEGKTYAPGVVHGLADVTNWIALFVKSIQDIEGQIVGILNHQSAQDTQIQELQKEVHNLQMQLNAKK